MLMTRVEPAVVNSPPRCWLQRRYEARMLHMGGQLLPGSRTVELGCGSGYGMQLALTQFGADQVHGVDLDPVMVARARRRLARHGEGRVTIVQGCANETEAM